MASSRARYRPQVPVKPEPGEVPSGANHSHKQPRDQVIRRNITEALVGLLAIALLFQTYQVYKLQQGQAETTFYLGDARDRRDTQNEELNRRIDDAVCDVLDQLPAGGLFDPIRAQYGCGPGIPVDELNPDAAQNLADILGELDEPQTPQPAAEPAQPTSAPDELPPGFPPGTQPTPGGQPTTTAAPTSAPVTPAPTTAPATTSAPPLVDLSTVTDRVCDALGICL